MTLKDKIKLSVFKFLEKGVFLREFGIYNTLLCDDLILDYIYSAPSKSKTSILIKMNFDLKSKNQTKQNKTIKTISMLLIKSLDEPDLKKEINKDMLSLMFDLSIKEEEETKPTVINILGHEWREHLKVSDNWMDFFTENWSMRRQFHNIIYVIKEEELNEKLESLLPFFNELLYGSDMYFTPRYDDDNLHDLMFLLGVEVELQKKGVGNKERYDKILSIIYEVTKNNFEAEKIRFNHDDNYRRRDDTTMKGIIKKLEDGEMEFFDFYSKTRMFVAGYYDSDICSFNRVRSFELSRLTVRQINNINLKSYNKVVDLAMSEYGEDSSESYIKDVVSRMYLVLGVQKSLDIINGVYGEVDFQFLENIFGRLYTHNIIIPKFKAEPVYDKSHLKFLDFWFAGSSLDPNANIKKLFSGEIDPKEILFSKSFDEWDTIYEILDGDVTLDKVKTILKGGLISLVPAREEIREVFKFLSETPANVTAAFALHNLMIKRTTSSIPKVYGHHENFEYEMLDLNDPEQLIVGDLTDCCFTINGISHSSLKHGVTNKNGRVFVVREDDQIVAQSWVWRNGNVLCFDNIEKSRLKSEVDVIGVYKKAALDIMEISTNNEPKESALNLITIGMSYTKDIEDMERLEIEMMPRPNEPDLYVDSTHQVILHQSKDFNLKDINYFDPEIQYQDPRQTIKDWDFSTSYSYKADEVVNVMNKVGYFNDQDNHIDITKEDALEQFVYVVYNNDWYIAIREDNTIEQKMLWYDKRAKEEVEDNLIKIKENISNAVTKEKVRIR